MSDIKSAAEPPSAKPWAAQLGVLLTRCSICLMYLNNVAEFDLK